MASIIKEFVYPDPEYPDMPDIYRVGEFDNEPWDNPTNEGNRVGCFWVINVGDICGALRVNPGEIDRLIEILGWMKTREQERGNSGGAS